MLSEDICSLSRNSKEKFDVLGDLEARVQKLRYTNMHGSSNRPWADRQVHSCNSAMLLAVDTEFAEWKPYRHGVSEESCVGYQLRP